MTPPIIRARTELSPRLPNTTSAASSSSATRWSTVRASPASIRDEYGTPRAWIGSHHCCSESRACSSTDSSAPGPGACTATISPPVSAARSTAQSRARRAPSEPSSPTTYRASVPTVGGWDSRMMTTGQVAYSRHCWLTDPSSSPSNPPSPLAPTTIIAASLSAAARKSAFAAGPPSTWISTSPDQASQTSSTSGCTASRTERSISSGDDNADGPSGPPAIAGYCHAVTTRSAAPRARAIATAHSSAHRDDGEPSTPTITSSMSILSHLRPTR